MNLDNTLIHKAFCWTRLGWFDILSRYRQTTLGPLWIVLLTFIIVIALSVVYGSLFAIPLKDFLPYVAIGLIFWGWISSIFLEAASCFQASKFLLLNHKIEPHFVLIRVFVRNTIILFHNLIVVLFVLAFYDKTPTLVALLTLPAFLLNSFLLYAISTLIALACSRFKDLVQALTALMNVGLLITPVIWSPDILSDRAYVAYLNPFTHMIALIREPLLGRIPSTESWIVVTLLLCLFGGLSAFFMKKNRYQFLFWI